MLGFFFRKIMLNTPTFANNFNFIWIFSYSHYSSPNKMLKMLGLLVVCINRMPLHTVYTTCAKIVDERNNRLFCCLSDRDFEPRILLKGVHLTKIEKKCLWRKVYKLLSRKAKMYMSPYYCFFLYSVWVHVENQKYKMIYLKSPKSSEFAIIFNKQWSNILIYVYFIIF